MFVHVILNVDVTNNKYVHVLVIQKDFLLVDVVEFLIVVEKYIQFMME